MTVKNSSRRRAAAAGVITAALLAAGAPVTAWAATGIHQPVVPVSDKSEHHSEHGSDHHKVSIHEAVHIAEKAVQGRVTGAELEEEKLGTKEKRTVWTVEVECDGTTYEVWVDPHSGKVLRGPTAEKKNLTVEKKVGIVAEKAAEKVTEKAVEKAAEKKDK
ncbi:PepSY domain-containing protein [Streptomyces albireticuli]|uniref:PepSY domain-containing protein n=1 Tax=Streptomyces albireticuli TaxID=1940 RepID=UPI0036815949